MNQKQNSKSQEMIWFNFQKQKWWHHIHNQKINIDVNSRLVHILKSIILS